VRKKTIEDYLQAICCIGEINPGGKVRSVEVAKYLGVSKPSVHEAVEKLAKRGYIKKNKTSCLKLTKKGLAEARKIVHSKRVLEVFLVKYLKCNPKKIDKEVHSLEHAFSSELIERLDGFVGNPKYCPHGKTVHIGGE